MSCERIRDQLTRYLEGELEGDRGSVVRGHLRACAACRQIATDEAALRDGLRALPPVDPPPTLWAGVQARLAAAEVEDSKRPAWRRAWRRWMPSMPSLTQLALGGGLTAAAVMLVWWRAQGAPVVAPVDPPAALATAPAVPSPLPRATGPAGDVTAELQAEAAQRTETYAHAAEELLALAAEARPTWSPEQQGAFDAKLAALRAEIGRATEGRARQRAWRDMIRYLQGAVIRDEIALAGGAQ